MNKFEPCWFQLSWRIVPEDEDFGLELLSKSGSDPDTLTNGELVFTYAWIDSIKFHGLKVTSLHRWDIFTVSVYFFAAPVQSLHPEFDECCRKLIQDLIGVRGDFIQGQDQQVVWRNFFLAVGSWGKTQLA